jgi:DNA-binding transcriptional regulator GbsR (MarR family)
VLVVFNISIKAHFVSKFVGERQIVFDINKDIVKTIVSNMTYKIEDEVDSDNEDVEENLVFSNEAKQTVVLV